MRYLFTLIFIVASFGLQAQFVTVGNASALPNNCFEITPSVNAQIGGIWQSVPIDLNNPFEFYGSIFLGCSNSGGDGIAFVMQSDPRGVAALGNFGNFLGYAGTLNITPSVAIEFDTYQLGGSSDPVFDHTAILSNGSVDHASINNLAGPVQLDPLNADVEDCGFHDIHIKWEPDSQRLSMWWDCNLRISYTGDIVNNIFNGNSTVNWGFTGATGALNNQHQVCVHEFYSESSTRILCEGDTISIDAGPGTNYLWTPFTNLSDATVRNPQFWPDTTTTYSVGVVDSCGVPHIWRFTVQVDDPNAIITDLGQDFNLCTGQDSVLDLFRPGASFLWQDGSTDSAYLATTPGLYWLEISNFCGSNRDSLNIGLLAPPSVDLGPDDTACVGDTIRLDVPAEQASYLWQDASTDSTFEVTQGGLYYVNVSNECGQDTDSVVYSFFTTPTVVLPEDTFFCVGDSLFLDPFVSNNVSYLWSDNSTNTTLTVRTPGIYWLEVRNQCGVARDSIVVTTLAAPEVDFGPDDTLCVGDTLVLNASSPSATYIWQDASRDSIFSVVQAGIYAVLVSNACGIARDTIGLDFQEPPQVFLGNDTVICDSSTLFLDATFPDAVYLWQNGVGVPTFEVDQTGIYFVSVSTTCGTTVDTIAVGYSSPPLVDLGPDQSVCEGTTVIFDATTVFGSTYVWQDGNTSPTYEAFIQGVYEVTAINVCGFDQDSIFLEVLSPLTSTNLVDTSQVCIGDSVTLITGQGNSAHLWSDQSTDTSLTVSETGTYTVTITNACGELTDTTTVIQVTPPQLALGSDQEFCEGESITLNASWPFSEVLWDDNSTAPFRAATETGVYSATLSNICGTTSDAIALTFNPAPEPVDLGNDRPICEGDSIVFDVIQPDLTPQPLYSWQDNRTGPTYIARFGGFYQVVVRNECGESVASVNLNEIPQPEVTVFGDSVLCENEVAMLEAFSPSNTPITWPDGSVGSSFVAEQGGIVVVRAENDCGVATDSFEVRQADCFCRITVPTAFTPNGDGFNDEFQIVTVCGIDMGIWRIIDRWGRTVFESNDPNAFWFGFLPNGEEAPDGVYIWNYQFFTRGVGAEQTVREETGTVTLFR